MNRMCKSTYFLYFIGLKCLFFSFFYGKTDQRRRTKESQTVFCFFFHNDKHGLSVTPFQRICLRELMIFDGHFEYT